MLLVNYKCPSVSLLRLVEMWISRPLFFRMSVSKATKDIETSISRLLFRIEVRIIFLKSPLTMFIRLQKYKYKNSKNVLIERIRDIFNYQFSIYFSCNYKELPNLWIFDFIYIVILISTYLSLIIATFKGIILMKWKIRFGVFMIFTKWKT